MSSKPRKSKPSPLDISQTRASIVGEELDAEIDMAKERMRRGEVSVDMRQYIGGLLLLKQRITTTLFADDELLSKLVRELQYRRNSAGRPPGKPPKLTPKQDSIASFAQEYPKSKDFALYETHCIEKGIPPKDRFTEDSFRKNIGRVIELVSRRTGS